MEIVDSRWIDWLKVGIASIIADNGANGALVLGAAVTDWRKVDLPGARATLSYDGKQIAEGTGATAMGDPFEALVWLANDLSRRGFGLRQGDAVTTGTVAGVHYAEAGMRVVADFGALGKAEVTFTP